MKNVLKVTALSLGLALASGFAAADENKRLGATLVNKPMGYVRSNAEIMNLTIIHKAITEIIAERAETFQHASVTLELFGESKPVTVYYESFCILY